MKDATPATRTTGKLAAALFLLSATILCGDVVTAADAADPKEQVVFVCEHGSVKSVMAAAYFNELAIQRKLPLRAVSRGVAPDSSSVPPTIVAGLQTEGIDVSDYRPLALSSRDVSQSLHVVAIGAELAQATPDVTHDVTFEQWNDVPPASTNYAAARDALRAHVRNLLERLSTPAPE